MVDLSLPSLDETPRFKEQCLRTQNPHAASIDSSRIIRADYADLAYARLARTAQEKWRKECARSNEADPIYKESGVILTADASGSQYVDKAAENARALGYHIQALHDSKEIEQLLGTGGVGGYSGYMNWGSGWANNGRAMERCMGEVVKKARGRREDEGKIIFRRGHVQNLVFETNHRHAKQQQREKSRRIVGAKMDDGEELRVDLTILAAGAWSGALIDLRGRVEATGQVLAYVPITELEVKSLKRMPVILNLSTGLSLLPPVRDANTGDWVLKILRHAYGYVNPTTVSVMGEDVKTSLPHASFSPIPREGEEECRAFLQQTVPWLGDRAFSSTRICWYTDTPRGNFLISHHPSYAGLFLATGGSGHGFKFLPVLGEKILAAIEGNLEEELMKLWRWVGEEEKVIPFEGTEDGSRAGRKGMVLEDEWKKGRGLVSVSSL